MLTVCLTVELWVALIFFYTHFFFFNFSTINIYYLDNEKIFKEKKAFTMSLKGWHSSEGDKMHR